MFLGDVDYILSNRQLTGTREVGGLFLKIYIQKWLARANQPMNAQKAWSITASETYVMPLQPHTPSAPPRSLAALYNVSQQVL